MELSDFLAFVFVLNYYYFTIFLEKRSPIWASNLPLNKTTWAGYANNIDLLCVRSRVQIFHGLCKCAQFLEFVNVINYNLYFFSFIFRNSTKLLQKAKHQSIELFYQQNLFFRTSFSYVKWKVEDFFSLLLHLLQYFFRRRSLSYTWTSCD